MESLQTGSSTIFTLPSTMTLVAAKYHIQGIVLCIVCGNTLKQGTMLQIFMDAWTSGVHKTRDTSHLVQDLVYHSTLVSELNTNTLEHWE